MPKKKLYASEPAVSGKSIANKNPMGAVEIGSTGTGIAPKQGGISHGIGAQTEPAPPVKTKGTLHWNQPARRHHPPAGKPQGMPKASRSLNNIHKLRLK